MQKLYPILFSLLILVSCTGEKSNSASGGGFVSAKVVDALLEDKFIFNMDTVLARAERVNKDQLTRARQLFMKGLDFYVNQKNPAESAKLFRESIRYNPDYQTYTYLGNAYVDMGDTLRADSALAYFYDEPDADRHYAMARSYAAKKQTGSAINYLSYAFSAGFLNKKKLENEKLFDYLRSEPGYQALVVTYLKDDAKLQAAFFKRFLDSAPDISLPYAFGRDSIAATQAGISNLISIDYDYAVFVPGMEDSRFSRDVSNSYYLVGKLKLDNGNFAVIYKSVMVIVDTLPSVDVNLAIYDSLGNVGEIRTLARFELPESLTTGVIDEDKVITLKDFRMKWRKDPLENGYSGNEYLGEELTSETKLIIGTDGKFISAPEKDKNAVAKQE